METNTKLTGMDLGQLERAIARSPLHKIVEVKIGDQVFEIQVKTKMGLEEKNAILSRVLELMEDLRPNDGEVATLIAAVDVMSNLTFPETNEKLGLFMARLFDYGILEKIVDEFEPNWFKDLATYMEAFADVMPTMIEEWKNETYGGDEPQAKRATK